MTPLLELEAAYRDARRDPAFRRAAGPALAGVRRAGPTPLYFAERLTEHAGGARIYLKREDLCHTGAHKINNALGQALLAARMGKPRVIAETGAGQHGVATATVAALLGLECEVYMGEEDVERQALNVFRMKLLGARVIPVELGQRTLKDAINEALRDWVTNVRTTYYLLGSVAGPHPYPMMVRDFQSRDRREARARRERRGPAARRAGGLRGRRLQRASGLFYPFIDDRRGAHGRRGGGGRGLASGQHGASLPRARSGVLHGSMSYLLQDEDGQVADGPLDLGRPRLSRASGPSTRSSRTRAAPSTSR